MNLSSMGPWRLYQSQSGLYRTVFWWWINILSLCEIRGTRWLLFHTHVICHQSIIHAGYNVCINTAPAGHNTHVNMAYPIPSCSFQNCHKKRLPCSLKLVHHCISEKTASYGRVHCCSLKWEHVFKTTLNTENSKKTRRKIILFHKPPVPRSSSPQRWFGKSHQDDWLVVL